MSIFNRVVVTVLAIALILFSAAAIVLPEQTLGLLATAFGNLSSFAVSGLGGRVLVTLGLLLLIALCVLVLWLELRRPPVKTVPVQKISGGVARVASDSVEQRVQYHVSQLAQVFAVKSQVSASGKKVDVLLDVQTSPEVNVPAKTEEISQVTRNVVQEQMGLRLGKLLVTVRHAPAGVMERKAPTVQPPLVPPQPVEPEEPKPAA
jgi:uncharacterized alkaline shock family protein YloU